jgi:hypothetical protein
MERSVRYNGPLGFSVPLPIFFLRLLRAISAVIHKETLHVVTFKLLSLQGIFKLFSRKIFGGVVRRQREKNVT